MVWLSDEVVGYVITLKNRSWVEETSAGSGLLIFKLGGGKVQM